MQIKSAAKAQKTSDPIYRHAAVRQITRHPVADLRRSIGNNTIQRLINGRYNAVSSPDESMPGVDPVEEDVIFGESMSDQDAAPAAHNKCEECQGGQGDCPKCALTAVSSDSAHGRAAAGRLARGPIGIVQRSMGNQAILRLINSPCLQARLNAVSDAPALDEADTLETPALDHTYTFISRGSYGATSPGFTRPSCAAGAGGTADIAAGSASPTVTVYPKGTYRVRRDDGVEKTATCTRLAAGLALTQAHEDSHAAGARKGVSDANSAQGLPKNYATAAECSAALPAILTAWNTSVDAVWANEVSHGPGTNQPTAPTFTEEHAAGGCTFT